MTNKDTGEKLPHAKILVVSHPNSLVDNVEPLVKVLHDANPNWEVVRMPPLDKSLSGTVTDNVGNVIVEIKSQALGAISHDHRHAFASPQFADVTTTVLLTNHHLPVASTTGYHGYEEFHDCIPTSEIEVVDPMKRAPKPLKQLTQRNEAKKEAAQKFLAKQLGESEDRRLAKLFADPNYDPFARLNNKR